MDGAGTETQFGFFALGLQGKGVPFDHQHNLKFPVLHCYIPTILYHIYYTVPLYTKWSWKVKPS